MGKLLGSSKNERDRDVDRKREKRSESARIEIPPCVNPKRREKCLQDPELFLRTYFADRYRKPFDADRMHIVETVWDLAQTRGRHAMAAPRGRGKTEICKGVLVAAILAGFVRFPLVGGQTTGHGHKIFSDIRRKFADNELLYQDFPEVSHPVRELEGAPQRSAKQHVDGQLTRIVWQANGYLSFPHVPGSPYGGVKLSYFGLDAAFRGVNIDGDRPDFVVIDDPETEESARSIDQIEKREKLINQDIAGLAEEGEEIAIAVFSTIQNRYCLSYRLTDPKQYPQFSGKRFGMVVKWPKRMDLWEEYISVRKAEQMNGDRHALKAVQFYLDNREEMDRGAEMITDEVGSSEFLHSSLQSAFNKIADTNMQAFRTEYQNDPEPEEEIQTAGLTAANVQASISKLPQREVASDTIYRTVGLDIGKYNSHWTDTAWQAGAVGSVVDYGIMETHGLSTNSDNRAVELALLASLDVWANEIVAEINPQVVLIDAGTYTQAVYEFCRRKGKPFFPSKGWDSGRFRIGKRTDQRIPFLQCYAQKQPEESVWLYNVDTEWWKKWLQDRFLTDTFSEGERNPGSLALFDPAGDRRRHLSFAHHITAEEEQLVPVVGKELKRVWYVKNRNNHWLDATALACAGAGVLGVRVVNPEQQQPSRRRARVVRNNFHTPHGRSFVATGR